MISWDKVAIGAAALLFAPIVGALLQGVDRRLTARIQGRQGPPLLQPFYDLFKLLGKEQLIVNRMQIVYAWLHLTFMAATVMMLALGQDSLMLLFVLAFSTLSLVIGGMCVRSPYSRIGSQREILLMVAYEPILVLMVVGFYLVNHSFSIATIWQADQPLIMHLPLLFVALLAVAAIKLQKSPFDLASSHHAHQEIVKGITIEYSGPGLAVLELAHFYETALVMALLALFWATNWWIGGALALGAYLLVILLDNACARLTTLWMFKFMWTVVLGLALTNIIWLYLSIQHTL